MDVSADLEQTYRSAMELGIDTVLTSGGASSCSTGKAARAALDNPIER